MSSLYFFFNIIAVYFFFIYNFLNLFISKITFYPIGIYLSILLIIWFYYMLIIANKLLLNFFSELSAIFEFLFKNNTFVFLMKNLMVICSYVYELCFFFGDYYYVFIIKKHLFILSVLFIILTL